MIRLSPGKLIRGLGIGRKRLGKKLVSWNFNQFDTETAVNSSFLALLMAKESSIFAACVWALSWRLMSAAFFELTRNSLRGCQRRCIAGWLFSDCSIFDISSRIVTFSFSICSVEMMSSFLIKTRTSLDTLAVDRTQFGTHRQYDL